MILVSSLNPILGNLHKDEEEGREGRQVDPSKHVLMLAVQA